MKLKLLIELEYDMDVWHYNTPEGNSWFRDEVLGDKEGLTLFSSPLNDDLGKVLVLEIQEVPE